MPSALCEDLLRCKIEEFWRLNDRWATAPAWKIGNRWMDRPWQGPLSWISFGVGHVTFRLTRRKLFVTVEAYKPYATVSRKRPLPYPAVERRYRCSSPMLPGWSPERCSGLPTRRAPAWPG
jgi:hypothetical protein